MSKKTLLSRPVLNLFFLIGLVFLGYAMGKNYAFSKISPVIIRLNVSKKVVALTFDDGPYPKYTEKILDVLDKYNAKATFFMIGSRVAQYPDIARKVANHGHIIGNHSYNHPKNITRETTEQILQEITSCEEEIKKVTGQKTTLYRSPSGLFNSRVIKAAKSKGYEVVNWSVCVDNKGAPTPELMAKRVTDNIKPGMVILVHDGRFPGRWKDVEATRIILKELTNRGYKFVTIPELIEISGHEYIGLNPYRYLIAWSI